MRKIYVDDSRVVAFKEAAEAGYNCVRTYSQCVMLLSVFKSVDVINLDYDLGESKTGLDILKYIVNNNIQVKEIYIHSTHTEGVRMMEKYIFNNLQHTLYTYSPALDE